MRTAMQKITMFARDAFADEFAHQIVLVAGEVERAGRVAFGEQSLHQYLGLRSLARTVGAVYYDERAACHEGSIRHLKVTSPD